MGDKSGIGWTDATWNPVTGCSRVSPGCEHCYAEALSLRRGWSKNPWTAQNAAENVVRHPERLDQPLHWRKPRRVFVNSMSDLFHEQVPDEFIDRVFKIMQTARHHIFQVLTKRPERMRDYLTSRVPVPWGGFDFPEPWGRHIWVGVSVEDQRRADERIPILLETPAAVRWVSCEPLLAPVSFRWAKWHPIGRDRITDHLDGLRRLDWVVVGGESGPGHRPMEIAWIESIVDQCQSAGVPVFVKQDSGPRPSKQGRIPDDLWVHQYPAHAMVEAPDA